MLPVTDAFLTEWFLNWSQGDGIDRYCLLKVDCIQLTISRSSDRLNIDVCKTLTLKICNSRHETLLDQIMHLTSTRNNEKIFRLKRSKTKNVVFFSKISFVSISSVIIVAYLVWAIFYNSNCWNYSYPHREICYSIFRSIRRPRVRVRSFFHRFFLVWNNSNS